MGNKLIHIEAILMEGLLSLLSSIYIIVVCFHSGVEFLTETDVRMGATLCSEGSMFRRSYIPKFLYSESSMLRRFYIPKVLCSEGSIFRRF